MGFTVVTLDQKSDEWKQWRLKGIGASEAPIILGLSPYCKPYRLWQEKTGQLEPKPFNSFLEERAQRIENAARATLEMKVGVNYPAVCLQSTEHDWLKTSLDGYNADMNSVMEAKYVGAGKENGKIPAHHWVQMQHQMAITGSPDVVYMRSSDGVTFYDLVVSRDDTYIKMMLDEEESFWLTVVTRDRGMDARRASGWRKEVKLADNVICE